MAGGVEVRIDPSRLQRFLRAVGGPGDRLLRRKTSEIARRARVLAAPHGTIPQGITAEVVNGQGVVRSTNPHTQFVIFGTRPHIIRPRRARALRFTVGGRTVYAKVVHHPGYRGHDFLTEAMQQSRGL